MTAHCSWAGRPGPTTFPPTTADGARASGRRDRKSTRLNSSHSQISYAVSLDQKSTRLNSSHSQISYAVFCLKKKKSEATPFNQILQPNARREMSLRQGKGSFAGVAAVAALHD